MNFNANPNSTFPIQNQTKKIKEFIRDMPFPSSVLPFSITPTRTTPQVPKSNPHTVVGPGLITFIHRQPHSHSHTTIHTPISLPTPTTHANLIIQTRIEINKPFKVLQNEKKFIETNIYSFSNLIRSFAQRLIMHF